MSYTSCPSCGFSNAPGRTTCKSCRKPLDSTILSANSPAKTLQSTSVNPLPVSASGHEYLVIPFLGNLTSGAFTSQSASSVTTQLQDVINRYVSQGWDYYSMEKVNIQVTPGCLAALFGKSVEFITFDQIIFRRSKNS